MPGFGAATSLSLFLPYLMVAKEEGARKEGVAEGELKLGINSSRG